MPASTFQQQEEVVLTRRTSVFEEIARKCPLGKPLHAWPGRLNDFNEYEYKVWYYCTDMIHVIGAMLFFVAAIFIGAVTFIVTALVCLPESKCTSINAVTGVMFSIPCIVCFLSYCKIRPVLVTIFSVFCILDSLLCIALTIYYIVIYVRGDRIKVEVKTPEFGSSREMLLAQALIYVTFLIIFIFAYLCARKFRLYMAAKLKAMKKLKSGSKSLDSN